MFTDTVRKEVYDQLREHDLRVFAKYCTAGVFLEAARRAGLRLWSCPLNLANLAWLGIAAAWRKGESFVTILTVTLKLLQDQEHFHRSPFGQDLTNKQRCSRRQRDKAKKHKTKASKHRPHGQDPTQVTEEAFAKARQRMPLAFWVELIALLGERFDTEHGERLRFRGFRVLAIDGTRLTLPDEKALRTFYGTANNGKGQHNAQARMVLLQSPLTRLPLAYHLQPVKVGEVTMARHLAAGLRAKDLLLLDSGYVSYGLLWDIQRRSAFFCLRLQRPMNLRTVRRNQRTGERWVRWTPKDSRGQWRREGLPRSLDLRLIEYRVPGHRRIQLVTNVLSDKRLSYADFCRLTTKEGVAEKLLPGLYHLRWQIETSYAEMKIGQHMEGGFRSRTPTGIAYEVAGHVVLYLLVRWLIVEAAERHGVDPLRISFSNALRELQQIWATMVVSSPEWVAGVLLPRLLERIASHIVPFRPGRNYPRKKKAKGKTTKSKRKKS
jgi:Transposase DDE domain